MVKNNIFDFYQILIYFDIFVETNAMIMRNFLCLRNLATLCLFVIMVHPDTVYAQSLLWRSVVRSIERGAIKNAAHSSQIAIEKSGSIAHQLQEAAKAAADMHNGTVSNEYLIPRLTPNKPIVIKRSYNLPNIYFTRQFVSGKETGVRALVSLAKKEQLTLHIINRESLRSIEDFEKNYLCFINSSKDSPQVTFRTQNLKPKEVHHVLHRLDILQQSINNEFPVFYGDFSKAKINIESDYIDIIVPGTEGKKQILTNTKLLVRIMGVIPVSLRNMLNKCLVEKVCTPEAVVIQLMHDLMNNDIKPENVRCELLQGIMAFNDVNETNDRNYYA